MSHLLVAKYVPPCHWKCHLTLFLPAWRVMVVDGWFVIDSRFFLCSLLSLSGKVHIRLLCFFLFFIYSPCVFYSLFSSFTLLEKGFNIFYLVLKLKFVYIVFPIRSLFFLFLFFFLAYLLNFYCFQFYYSIKVYVVFFFSLVLVFFTSFSFYCFFLFDLTPRFRFFMPSNLFFYFILILLIIFFLCVINFFFDFIISRLIS
jgi:hypothetical protein